MKTKLLLPLLSLTLGVLPLLAEPKYFPKDKDELLKLVKNESIKLDEIDVSKITDMSYLFCRSDWHKCENSAKERKDFSGIEKWDVSNAEDMRAMFAKADTFNQPLDAWNVGKVKDMGYMFAKATTFNQPLDSWNVNNVENMNGMFFGASAFNQTLQNWKLTHLKENRYMFYKASSFSQSLKTWGDKAPKKEGFSYGYYGFFEAIRWIGLDKDIAEQYFTLAISKSKIYNLREDAKVYLAYLLFSQNPNSPEILPTLKEYFQKQYKETGNKDDKFVRKILSSNDASSLFKNIFKYDSWGMLSPQSIEYYSAKTIKNEYIPHKVPLDRIFNLPNSYKLHSLRGYGADLHNHGNMGPKGMFWPLGIHPREFFANPDFNHDYYDLWCDDGFIDGRTYVSLSVSGDTIRVYFDWIYPIILQNPDLKQAYEDAVFASQEYYKEILGVDEQTANDFGRMWVEFNILNTVYAY